MGFQRLATVVVLPPASDVALTGRGGSAGAAGSLFLPAAGGWGQAVVLWLLCCCCCCIPIRIIRTLQESTDIHFC